MQINASMLNRCRIDGISLKIKKVKEMSTGQIKDKGKEQTTKADNQNRKHKFEFSGKVLRKTFLNFLL